jgi:hypothetical protein
MSEHLLRYVTIRRLTGAGRRAAGTRPQQTGGTLVKGASSNFSWPKCLVLATVLAALAAFSGSVAEAAERAPGTGRPPKGTGMNTGAAYRNPLCDRDAGAYGRMGLVTAQGGPVCLAVWKGKDNGGATYRGVTADSILVVALVPNDQQLAALGSRSLPTNYATGGSGTVPDALSDSLAPYEHVFGGTYTYGRDVDLEFVVSSGVDEASQRADAVTVKSMKPFIVLDIAGSLQVFDTVIAAAKIPVFSLFTTVDATLKQAPYRWGQQDNTAATINGAEFVGKQLAGKKAQYAGDAAMHDETRKFGLVLSDLVESDFFDETLADYDVEIASAATFSYPGSDAITGDAAVAQEHAPVAITKLKAAGVTTVLLLADPAMVTALTQQATAQDYQPEWVYLGSGNIDFPLLGRTYDQEQWAHAFGLSNVPPGSPTAPTTAPNIVQWYWGPNRGTFGINYANAVSWLMSGIMYAGPELTPQTFRQGYFALPAGGGSASSDPALRPRGVRFGYGRTNGLPYQEYMRGNKDFAVSWWDPDTEGPPTLGFPGGRGALWYPDGAKRYYAGAWPKKPIKFFDESNSIYQFDAPSEPVEVLPCAGCPSETG